MFLKAKTEKRQMAFGVIPAYCRYELFMERYRAAAEFIRKEKPKSGSINLLDVGAGEGYLKYFCDWPWITFSGVEAWQDRFQACQALGYRMTLHDIEKARLPFPDGEFEVVVASHILEHLVEPQKALAELIRVTRPDGLLILGLPMHPMPVAKLLEAKNVLVHPKSGEHLHFYHKRSLRAFLQYFEPGARVVDIRGFRLISARRRANWEDKEGFYKFNVWFGKKYPYLTREVNIVLRKAA